MKKEYAHCILGLIILFLGVSGCVAAILLTSLADSSKSALFLLGICLIITGIMTYAKHSKQYIKIKYLTEGELTLIAHWHFEPHSSKYIDEAFYERKISTIYTLILSFLLGLIIACCVFFSGEKYSGLLSLSLLILDCTALSIALIYNSLYYQSRLSSPAELFIGEDSIYFLDELHTLNKSIYFLEDIRINYSDENSLQFLYGDYDLFTGPMCTLNIPIPEGELETAKAIQKHYLNLIHYEYE